MCQAAMFKDPSCKCQWMAIVQPCWPGFGFNNCPTFFNGITKEAPPFIKATKICCPKHDLEGMYDRNLIRMVVKVEKGLRWGMGPDERDPGVDIKCAVM
ncbi:hypothetical protein MCOR27_007058 [Pyricularia oryzae]|uniref:Uncharacterized protein n=5 Tax=Pyricularia TaxID=48558 RepID=A0ABQ8N7K4_PYRGI|nr:uncharacterized protein MGG_15564 [Pyricularia oryzae 70-15]ELQ42772.1 hypothetical protein OOU_Y34scaffold00194g85 [Pyricularia oryzae Y34]KAH8837387.1 hypothetical protein MCOR01_011013 [Pyricularia oryzae]KAI6292557.1 hypothetical protein MCOR33_009769 [Pyricularia grisea]EHA53882.1 hypothetical protein MGG_15564 [Pyricularia oryzae 70-15]KAI6253689.1 hypothetical protein MCOR19_009766 [Pyricularia oryzae]